MLQPSNLYQRSAGFRLLTAGVIFAITAAGCTRDPVDTERGTIFNEDEFTFQIILESEPILDVVASSSTDGRMAAAVVTGSNEVTVMESSAGSWSEVGTLGGGSLETSSVDIAPAQGGAWWILATDTGSGVKLYRIGGGLDSTLTIPVYESSVWDTSGGCIASDTVGRPIIILRASGESLIRAAIVDTGWALSPVEQSSESSRALDFINDQDGTEHLVFRPLTGGTASYRLAGSDTTGTWPIPRTEQDLSLSLEGDGTAHIVGPLSDISIVVFWDVDIGLDRPETIPVYEPYLPNSAAIFDLDDSPYVVCGKFRSQGRYDLVVATRSPDDFDINWDILPVIQDAPSNGARNRLQGFALAVDAFGTPHILFLDGAPGNVNSTLWEAVPKD